MSGKRRLFVGFPISSELARQVIEWQRVHTRLPARWVSGRNLHLTIIPPWEEDDPATLVKTIKDLSYPRPGALTFSFHTINFGPDPEEPRLIWATAETPAGFAEFKYRLEEGIWQPHDTRPLRPHLTIARFPAEDFRRFSQKVLAEPINWSLSVEEFVVYESRRGGGDYQPLARFRLTD
jgi:2'-5' RNA ligase